YSSKDRTWVAELAEVLTTCGYKVWWDRELLPGDNYHKKIENALNKARCVVTVWSEHSVESKWVLSESGRADKRGVLIPVIYRSATIPLAFDTSHNADLQQWQVLVSSLLAASVLAAERDSSLHGKTVEMTAEDNGTAIIQTGDGRIIGKTGELIKELSPSKPAGNFRNSSISASENLTIKATGQGTVIVQTGDGTIVYEANKEAVEQLGIAENSLASFFAILQVEDIPVADWEPKLSEIAESFRELKQKLAEIQTSDEAIIDLKNQAEIAIDSGQFAEARKLLGQAEELAIDSHVENRLITAAEIGATKGALAGTQLDYSAMGEEYESAANKMAVLGEKHSGKWSEYLNWAGGGFYNAGQYKRAEPLYEKALSLRESNLPEHHNDIAVSLNNLASLYEFQGRYDEVEPLYQRSLSISEKVLGKDHPEVAITLNNLAGLYLKQGRYEKAEPLYQRSLSISEKTLGKNHPEVATTLNNLAGLYREQGRYDEAEPLYQRSLSIKEKALGKGHPEVAITLGNLAELYRKQGRYDEAEPLYQRSLSIKEKALGKDHPLLATTLNNLAGLYEIQGRYDWAEPLYQRSLSILEKALGKDHPEVAITLNNLAGLYRKQGRYDEAEPLYQRSLSISEKALGKDHPEGMAGTTTAASAGVVDNICTGISIAALLLATKAMDRNRINLSMHYTDLKSQRKTNTAWRLLASPHAALIASFLYQVFVQPNRRSLGFDEAVSALDDTLFYLNDQQTDTSYPKKASQYLDDWASGEQAFLRKYYQKGNDTPQLDLTPGAEKAIEWLQTLQPREFVGTESRLLTLHRLLQEIVQNTASDADQRIAELEKEKQDIDRRIARLQSGIVDTLDDTGIKERWFEAEDVARKLLSDFRQVEYNFRHLDREVRELITRSEKSKGDLLDEIFVQQDYIHDSEQGKSFGAFWTFLMSPNRQEELRELTETALQQDALREMDDTVLLRNIGYALLDAGQKVYQTNAQLVEQLRKYLADQAWLENKRILTIIRGIEQSALDLKQRPQLKLPADFYHIDQPKVALNLLMEQRLFSPARKTILDSSTPPEAQETVDVSALYRQHWVDEAALQDNIRRLLQTRPQISLREVLEQYPLQQGLAELVTYLNIASRSKRAIINEDITETLPLNVRQQELADLAVPNHELLQIRDRQVQMPQIIFSR
ncbi:unnamed protein product, partial [Cyprideis torosa]